MCLYAGRPFAFDHSLIDKTTGLKVLQRAFTRLEIK